MYTCENCTTGVLLLAHLHSRCITGVVHLGRGVLLGSLWVIISYTNESAPALTHLPHHVFHSCYEAVYGISRQVVKARRLTFSKFPYNMMVHPLNERLETSDCENHQMGAL